MKHGRFSIRGVAILTVFRVPNRCRIFRIGGSRCSSRVFWTLYSHEHYENGRDALQQSRLKRELSTFGNASASREPQACTPSQSTVEGNECALKANTRSHPVSDNTILHLCRKFARPQAYRGALASTLHVLARTRPLARDEGRHNLHELQWGSKKCTTCFPALTRSQAHQHSFIPEAVVNWNDLPDAIGTIPDSKQLRLALQNHLY